MKAWYLIFSKPRKEITASEQLKSKGYETYLPLLQLDVRKENQLGSAQYPMFPRYLFIRLCDETDNWEPIKYTIGVSNLVKFSNKPARIPDKLISSLRKYDEKGLYESVDKSNIKLGSRVVISKNNSSFYGLEAIVQECSPNDRVILLFNLIKRTITVNVKRADITEVD